ncbi:MAG: transglycosylase SLT domain-containing protein [Bacilli bacterium]|nr:transglycosylase SLT domain-containing protein [Bacilli bacterium]
MIYKFYYNNGPYCIVDSEEYKNARALYRLKKLDNNDYEKIVAGKNQLKLISKENVVIINNMDQYMKTKDLQRCLEDNYPIIKNELKKTHKTNKPLKNTKINAKKVIVGSLTLSMLLGSYKLKDLNITNTNDNKLKIDSTIEQENDSTIEEIKENVINDIKKENSSLSITFDNLSDSEKALYVQQTYGDLIEKYSTKWGIDSRLITAILTQESGGKDENLMQIEYNAWKNQLIEVKNFNDDSTVKIVLTEDPELYDSDVITINRTELKNPKTNISVGTILLRFNLKCFNYNIPISLTSYNCGTGTMNNILDETCRNTGYIKEELINDPTNLEFLNYRYIMTDGDQNYFENVVRYIPNYDEELQIWDENNELHALKVSFEGKTK